MQLVFYVGYLSSIATPSDMTALSLYIITGKGTAWVNFKVHLKQCIGAPFNVAVSVISLPFVHTALLRDKSYTFMFLHKKGWKFYVPAFREVT